MAQNWIVAAGSASALISVAAGAFGAHGLKGRLEADMLQVFETGARYQMYHALGLLLIGVLAAQRPERLLDASAGLLLTGTLLFSGSLYALALSGVRVLGAITPLGGLAFLAGWACLLVAALRGA